MLMVLPCIRRTRMSRTNRKNRKGKTHKEGQDKVFQCRCDYCTGKKNSVDKAHLKTISEMTECLYCGDNIGINNISHHLNGWCSL